MNTPSKNGSLGEIALPSVLFLLSFFAIASHAGLMDSEENRTEPGPPRNLAPPGATSLVVMLGTGNPLPDVHRFGPATAVVVNGTPYIFDAGEGVWRALAKAAAAHGGRIAEAFAPNNLTRLFITHQHADHTVGIPAFLMMPWYLGRDRRVEIYGPKGIARTVAFIMDAWRADADTRLKKQVPPETPEGWQATAHDLDIKDSALVYQDGNVRIEAYHHHHIDLEHNFAYRVTTPDRVIVIGGDGTGDERLVEAARDADVFIMEVATEAELHHAPWGGASIEEKAGVIWQFHVKPRRLAEIARRAGVKLLVLYHVQNYSDPYDPDALLKEIGQFYDGRVIQGRDADIY